MSTDQIIMAIVGCGQIAEAHIQQCRRIPGVVVSAVCDQNSHMVEQAAVRFDIPNAYTDLRTLLQKQSPTVLYITTPPSSHLPLARMALDSGVHVYLEKPFTVSALEARQIVDLAEQNQKLVCIGHNYVFESSFLRLREMYNRGALGEIVHIDAYMGYDLGGAFGAPMMKDPDHWVHTLPGGIPQNNLSHPLSMALTFMADEKPVVTACGFRLRKERFGDARDRFFDEVRVQLQGKESTANIRFSCSARPVQLGMEVYGTKAHVVVSSDARTLRMTKGSVLPGPFRKLAWARADHRESRREYLRHVSNLARSKLHFFEGIHELSTRFYRAIRGESPMPVPLSEGIRIAEIMDELFCQCRKRDPDLVPGSD